MEQDGRVAFTAKSAGSSVQILPNNIDKRDMIMKIAVDVLHMQIEGLKFPSLENKPYLKMGLTRSSWPFLLV